jgi:hypothetical protein
MLLFLPFLILLLAVLFFCEQVLQKKYDELAVDEDENDAEKAAVAETMANRMIELLTCIENDRVKYTEKRDDLKRMKQRCVVDCGFCFVVGGDGSLFLARYALALGCAAVKSLPYLVHTCLASSPVHDWVYL